MAWLCHLECVNGNRRSGLVILLTAAMVSSEMINSGVSFATHVTGEGIDLRSASVGEAVMYRDWIRHCAMLKATSAVLKYELEGGVCGHCTRWQEVERQAWSPAGAGSGIYGVKADSGVGLKLLVHTVSDQAHTSI
jgi:hypothetical protein